MKKTDLSLKILMHPSSKKHNNNKVRKSILYILDDIPSKANPHSWKHAFDQIVELSKYCNVTVIAPVYWQLSLRNYKQNKIRRNTLPDRYSEINSIPCWRPRYFDVSFFSAKFRKHYFQIFTAVLSTLFLIKANHITFDISHAHFVYKPGYIGTILGRLFRRPVVITAWGSDVHQNLNNAGPLYRAKTLKAIMWSTRVISVSANMKNLISEEGFGEKVTVIPGGFWGNGFYPEGNTQAKELLSLSLDTELILFIGNLVPIKGVDVLLHAIKNTLPKKKNIVLLLIGDGDSGPSLKKLAQNLNIEDSVVFLGRKDHTEITKFINASHVVVLPSRNEGRPTVLYEALACGKPVVATNVGGIPETITDDELGLLVESENPAALANAIVNALSRKWDSRRLRAHAQKYTVENIARQILKVYDDVLKEKNRWN